MSIIDHEQIENSPKLKAYYDDKRLFYRNVFWLIGGNVSAIFGQNTAMSLMPLHMANINLTARQISTVMAVSSWIGIPLILYVSHLTDHWQGKMGRRRPFLLLQLPFTFLGLAFFPFATTIWLCLLFYAMFYVFNSIKYASYPFLINDVSKQKYWGRINGFHVFFGYVGVWFGIYFLMPMVDTHGAKFVFITAACLMFIGELLTLLFIKEPPIRSEIPPRFNPIPVIWSTLRFGLANQQRALVCITFALCCGLGIVFYYIPLQAKVNMGLTEGQVGRNILQYGPIAGVIWAFCAGFVIDKFGPVKAMLTGYTFAVIAMLLGLSPEASAGVLHRWTSLTLSPVHLLAAAYLLNMTGNTFVYMGAQIFMMSSVRREDMAKLCACAGAVNLFGQSLMMLAAGWLITTVFDENYGVAFILSLVFTSFGIPLCFAIEYLAKRKRAEKTTDIGKIVQPETP